MKISRYNKKLLEESLIRVQLEENAKNIADIDKYYRNLKILEHDVKHHYTIIDTMLSENKIDEAIDEYKLASKYDPTDYLIYQNLGYLSERKGDIDSAIEYYSKSRKYSTDEEYKAGITEAINALKEQKKKKK